MTSKSVRLPFCSTLLALLLGIGPALSMAQFARPIAQAAAATAVPQTSIVVYDVRDLGWTMRQYPLDSAIVPPTQLGQPKASESAKSSSSSRITRRTRAATPAGGGYGMGGGMPGDGAAMLTAADANIVELLANLVQATVDPSSWLENGGQVGSLQILNGMLVVAQTEQNHKAIESLLAQLRQASSKMVRIHAHWLTLPPGELQTILVKPEAGKPAGAMIEVDPAALEKIESKGAAYRGQITCYNGQTVHITSGPTQTVIAGAQPVVADNVAAYATEPQLVQFGIALQATPLLSADSKTVTLDLQSIYSESNSAPLKDQGPTTRPVPTGGAPDSIIAGAGIDRLNLLVQEFRTSINVPVGKPILVAGMTLDPTVKADRTDQLYLVIEVAAPQ